jgi:gentisate 1,2-dioxygenase
VPDLPDDTAFAAPNIVPELPEGPARHSPVFRYPREASVQALKSAPFAKDGARKIRYINPLTGGPAMSLLDCYMARVEGGTETIPYRSTSNSVCVVVEGSGESRVGNDTFQWQPRDIFSMPHGNWISHRCVHSHAILFVVTDREVLRRLDLLVDEYGNERRPG